jgi:hypothetical protein
MKKSEHESPPSPKEQPPGPSCSITIVDEDDVEPPFTSCNAIDSGDLAELLEIGAMQLDVDTNASQEGAKKLKKPEQRRYDHHRSSSDCISIDIDGLIATMSMSPNKKKQQPITTPVTPETPERIQKHEITTTPASPVFSTTSSITDNTDDDLSTIQKASNMQYKRTMKSSSLSGDCGTLHDIIERVQFCAFYWWGELFDHDASDHKKDNENINDKEHHISKEKCKDYERMKEINDTFLGKMIQCGSVDYSCFYYYNIVSCRDDERDDCSVVWRDPLSNDI